MSVDLGGNGQRSTEKAIDAARPPAEKRARSPALIAATVLGVAMGCFGLAAVCWIELYIQAREPGWNAIPWTPLAWALVGAGLVIGAVVEIHVRWPRLVGSGIVRRRALHKAHIGWVIWMVAAGLGAFVVINRTWLGYYPNSATYPPASWTQWHQDPAAIVMFVIIYLGLWWEAGRLGRRWARRTLRALLFPIVPLLALLLILVVLGIAAGGHGFSINY